MMRIVRTAVVVVVVTLLVWAFAESESLRSQTLPVGLRLAAADDRLISAPEGEADGPGWSGPVSLTIDGSASAIDAFRDAVGRGLEFRLGEEVPTIEGEGTIDLAVAFARHEAVRTSGVTIADVDPPTLGVRVDRLVEVELPIRVTVSEAQLAGPPTPSRATAAIRLPERLRDALGPEATLTADLSADVLETLAPGRVELVRGVRLAAPGGIELEPGVTITPPATDVTISLRSRTASVTLATTPVHVRLPAAELGRWDVRVVGDTVLRDVTVSGPSEAIERVRSGGLPVVAVVSLTFEDLERGIDSKAASFTQLPTPLEFAVEDDQVRLNIRRLEPAPGPPDPLGQ
ncbi:MAG: hypothetical protein AAF297_06240 [Planctomycetota bacterium]